MDLWPSAMLGEALKACQSEQSSDSNIYSPTVAQACPRVPHSVSIACRTGARPCHEGADVCRLPCTSPAALLSSGIPSSGGVGSTSSRTPCRCQNADLLEPYCKLGGTANTMQSALLRESIIGTLMAMLDAWGARQV